MPASVYLLCETVHPGKVPFCCRWCCPALPCLAPPERFRQACHSILSATHSRSKVAVRHTVLSMQSIHACLRVFHHGTEYSKRLFIPANGLRLCCQSQGSPQQGAQQLPPLAGELKSGAGQAELEVLQGRQSTREQTCLQPIYPLSVQS